MISKHQFGNDVIYMENGVIHNENEPAWIHEDGSIEYFTKGKVDNKNGPARIHANGDKEYWIDGNYMGKEVDGLFIPWEQ